MILWEILEESMGAVKASDHSRVSVNISAELRNIAQIIWRWESQPPHTFNNDHMLR
jgi:hypothetical protein